MRETKPFAPAASAIEEQKKVTDASAAAAASAAPTVVQAPEPTPAAPSGGGGDAPAAASADAASGGEGTGPGSGGEGPGSPGTGDAPGEGGFARGGLVKGAGEEHPITAQAGEYVINAAAVKKYGLATIEAINRGKANVVLHKDAAKHFATAVDAGEPDADDISHAAGGFVGRRGAVRLAPGGY